MRTAIPTLLLLGLIHCAPSGSAARSSATARDDSAPRTASSAVRAPMTVEWIYVSEAAGRLTLVARVNRRSPIRIPTTVTVSVPAGVRLVSGRTSWVIDGSGSTGSVDETLVFEVTDAGPQEILLAADVQSARFGVHAKKAYKLGPTVQKSPSAPTTRGPALQMGEHDFGPSVPATP